jgi:hypothetical protein
MVSTPSGCKAELFRVRIVLVFIVAVPSMIVAAVGYWRASSLGAVVMGSASVFLVACSQRRVRIRASGEYLIVGSGSKAIKYKMNAISSVRKDGEFLFLLGCGGEKLGYMAGISPLISAFESYINCVLTHRELLHG